MDLIFIGLAGIALLLVIASKIQLIITAFQASLLWGLACLFIPLVSLIFIVAHWQDAKQPVGRALFAIILFFGTLYMDETTDTNALKKMFQKEKPKAERVSYPNHLPANR